MSEPDQDLKRNFMVRKVMQSAWRSEGGICPVGFAQQCCAFCSVKLMLTLIVIKRMYGTMCRCIEVGHERSECFGGLALVAVPCCWPGDALASSPFDLDCTFNLKAGHIKFVSLSLLRASHVQGISYFKDDTVSALQSNHPLARGVSAHVAVSY